MRWTIQAMLLAVAIVASVCGVYRTFWDDQSTNYSLRLGAFILLTCVAIVAAALGSRLRGAFAGAGLFGIVYLASVLRRSTLAKDAKIGLALFGIAFLAGHLIVMLTRPEQDAAKDETR